MNALMPLQATNASGAGAAGFLVVVVIVLAIAVFYIACGWRLFTKAGKPGWAAIIPFYSTVVMLKIIGRPWWWIFLLLIPFVNIVFNIIILLDLAKAFGKGSGFAVGLILLSPIFFPILALGSSRYLGPPNQALPPGGGYYPPPGYGPPPPGYGPPPPGYGPPPPGYGPPPGN